MACYSGGLDGGPGKLAKLKRNFDFNALVTREGHSLGQ